jgi:hypothetical protein
MKGSGSTAYRPKCERSAELIQSYFAEHQLRPGDRLPTVQGLGEQFVVSRTIVRDAANLSPVARFCAVCRLADIVSHMGIKVGRTLPLGCILL